MIYHDLSSLHTHDVAMIPEKKQVLDSAWITRIPMG